MALSRASLLRGLFLLVMALAYAEAVRSVFSLEEKVDDYVRNLAKENGAEVLWWDMHGEHEHLVKNANMYGRFRVKVTADPVDYGRGENSTHSQNVVWRDRSQNGQPLHSRQETLKKTTRTVRTDSWTVERAFGFGKRPLVAKAKGPSVPEGPQVQAPEDGEWDVDVSVDKVQVYERTEPFSLEEVVTIPAMKTIEIEWIITSVDEEIPWTSVVTVEGFFAVWFRTKVNGHNLWFYPVTVLDDPLLEPVSPGRLQFVARGRYTGVHAISSDIRVTEHDYGRPQQNASQRLKRQRRGFYYPGEIQLPPTRKPQAKMHDAAWNGVVSSRTSSSFLYTLFATNLLLIIYRK